jgi:NADPH:quinone reductase-like Zn-dependent oxidoreductase
VRLRVEAAALNRLDLFVVGGLPGVTITPPWVVGSDGAGVVDAVGPGVTAVRPGDRVVVNPGHGCGACEYCREGETPLCPRYHIFGEHEPGFLAEYAVVPESCVRVRPDHVTAEQAAAFSLATLTAWRMVVSRARVRPGDQVLVWGIGGGVALAALQICKRIGATVWATSSSPEKLERARRLGADHLLDHARDDVPRAIRAATNKRGADVVIDSVGEATWARSLLALGRAAASSPAAAPRARWCRPTCAHVLEPVDAHGLDDGEATPSTTRGRRAARRAPRAAGRRVFDLGRRAAALRAARERQAVRQGRRAHLTWGDAASRRGRGSRRGRARRPAPPYTPPSRRPARRRGRGRRPSARATARR